ncbi:MAG: hypothetical protein ACYTGQ_06255 [Planctomycetota bacterium]|jgi:hypothetical protein
MTQLDTLWGHANPHPFRFSPICERPTDDCTPVLQHVSRRFIVATQHLIEDPTRYAVNTLMEALIKKNDERMSMRNAPRMQFNVPITLHEKTDCGAYKHQADAFGIDISHDGVGFICGMQHRKGAVVFLNLKPVIGRPFFLPISITHSSPAFGTNYNTGGRFLFNQPLHAYTL